MREASETFAAQVTGSHKVAVRVQSFRGGELLADDVPITEGEITWDDTAAIPGTLTLTVAAGPDREWDPGNDPLHPLAPFGQRLYVTRGITGPLVVTELLPLGWWLIRSADPDVLGGGIKVVADSLERVLEESRFQRPEQPPPGGTFYSELDRLVDNRLPLGALPEGLLDRPIGAGRLWENNRLDAIGQLCAAWPARIRVGDEGALQLLPPAATTETAAPVMDLATGTAGVIANWSSATSREEIYNAVWARGEEESADARAVEGFAWDNDPDSPTYFGGPFGERPMEHSSPLLTTDAAATKAAETILARVLRRTRLAVVEMVPDPRLTTDDWVTLETPTVQGVGRVTGIRMPLTAAGGTATLTLEMDA